MILIATYQFEFINNIDEGDHLNVTLKQHILYWIFRLMGFLEFVHKM